MATTVSIVTANADYRAWLKHCLNLAASFHCVGTFSSLIEAMRYIGQEQPDLVLLGEELVQGAEAGRISKLRSLSDHIAIVVLLESENPDIILQLLAKGACGYAPKNSPPAQLLQILEQLALGGSPVSPQVARKLINFWQDRAPKKDYDQALSTREMEILELLAFGLQYKEIAERLSISLDTVRTYIRRLYAKLDVGSRSEVVLKYFRLGNCLSLQRGV